MHADNNSLDRAADQRRHRHRTGRGHRQLAAALIGWIAWTSCYGQSDGASRIEPRRPEAVDQGPSTLDPTSIPSVGSGHTTSPPFGSVDLETAFEDALASLRRRSPPPDVRELVGLLDRYEGAEEEALNQLWALRQDPAAPLQCFQVCLALIERGLRRHWSALPRGGDRQALDRFVLRILEAVPGARAEDEDLAGLLIRAPYLGVAHEEAILDLTSRSGDQQDLIPTASDLLQTLWRNLCAAGARTSRELTHLALLFRVDANRARRLAALRFLLTDAPAKFRRITLHEIVTTADAEVVDLLADDVARGAPADEALRILTRMAEVSPRGVRDALGILRQRDPGLFPEETRTVGRRAAEKPNPKKE